MRRLLLISCVSFFVIVLAAPLVASADVLQTPSIFPGGYWGTGGLVSCTGIYSGQAAAKKYCTSVCDIIQTMVNIIYFGITLVLFVFTPILFAWGGITYLTSGGSPARRENAKKILTGALIGLLIVIFAFVIVKLFVDFFSLSSFIQGFGGPFNCTVSG